MKYLFSLLTLTLLLACAGAALVPTGLTPAPATIPVRVRTPTLPPTAAPIPSAFLPANAVAILNIQAGSSAPQLAALGSDGRLSALPAPSSHTWQLSPDRKRLAGVTGSAGNVITVLDLQTGRAQSLEATDSDMIGGLAFSPDSQHIALTALQGPESRRWELARVNLNTGQRLSVYRGTWGGESKSGVPLVGAPVGWSQRTGEIILQAFTPYSDGCCGPVQAVRPDTAEARKILSSDQLIVTASLSPDGARLIYLTYDPAYPPQNYVESPGSPMNLLRALDLASGQSTTLLAERTGRALNISAALTADGSTVLVWRERYLPQDGDLSPYLDELLVVSPVGTATVIAQAPSETARLYGGLIACPDGSFLYAVAPAKGPYELWRVPPDLRRPASLAYRSDKETSVIACLR